MSGVKTVFIIVAFVWGVVSMSFFVYRSVQGGNSLKVTTDKTTGCEYLTYFNVIIPRVDIDGTHRGCNAK